MRKCHLYNENYVDFVEIFLMAYICGQYFAFVPCMLKRNVDDLLCRMICLIFKYIIKISSVIEV